MKKPFIFLLFVVFFWVSCSKKSTTEYQKSDIFLESVKALTDVIVYDIFSPPVASRVYVYPAIAAYEIMAQKDISLKTFSGRLHGFEGITPKNNDKTVDFSLATVLAYLNVGKALIFSEEKIQDQIEKVLKAYKDMGVSSETIEASKKYAQNVSKEILAWAEKDNYHQTRSFPKYTIKPGEATWKPTPPDYMEGIEPHWNKIRTFVIDSAQQFVPPPPTPYNMDKSSLFYKELMEVYEVGKNLDEEQTEIAKFWDCNPYVSVHHGHAMFALKKITPGGHWINITSTACKAHNLLLNKSIEAHAKTAIVLADAFISCWDEKWRSILIRPETVINLEIDPEWLPLLQTPPFPEYTSGHSVISAAASYMLTDFFGDDFAFVDSTEVEFGLPKRRFDSFFDASKEAAVSRLYGGIHYRPAIDNGFNQGLEIGEFVVKKLNQ